jgi:Di-haem oxidoreductase, putative peroxidase
MNKPTTFSRALAVAWNGRRARPTRIAAALAALLIMSVAVWAELGSNVPSDGQLLIRRATEGGKAGSGIFEIAVPPPGTVLHPVQRVRRNKFGVVGPFPLGPQDLDALVYPDATPEEREAVLEGMRFFTTAHHPGEKLPDGSEDPGKGVGPINNQPFCLGCHMNTADGIPSRGLLSPSSCVSGSTCVSLVSRAGRSTPTNFFFTSTPDKSTGGGNPAGRVCGVPTPCPGVPDGSPDPSDNLDAVHGPGRTAAFTVFGDFDPNHSDAPSNPTGIGFFDPLDGTTTNIVTASVSQMFGGFTQHTRPSFPPCVPKPIAPIAFDTDLAGSQDPTTGLFPSGFRRSVGERAGPPYIGRGLMEAVPTQDILANADPHDMRGSNSSLGDYPDLGCKHDCVAGKANMIPRSLVVHKDMNGNLAAVTGFVGGIGRFGLRANGAEMLQLVVGGLQGELSFTSLINGKEINFPTLFPSTGPASEPPDCQNARSKTPEVHLSEPFSVRNFIRNTAPPEFGTALSVLLRSQDPTEPKFGQPLIRKVRRGAELFGIDLLAFANRMVPGRMPAGGDGRDPHAINQHDRKLDCVGCHTPIQRTGRSPADVGAEHLSFVWAPIFSDLLLHKMPAIDAERWLLPAEAGEQRPRDPVVTPRENREGLFNTYDLPRNFADDAFNNLKASADGREFRTAPLMGLGRIGPPFMHDARVYLSRLTVDTTPAGTVTTNRRVTNAPLVVRTVDDAIRAAIELHDLPAPDDADTPSSTGAGCPVPASSNIAYGPSSQDVICPPYTSTTSKTNRSDSRLSIRRFRALSPEDQQAVIEFLKQL